MREVRVWFRDEAGNVSLSQSATIDLITPSYASSGTIDWGTSTNYLGVTVHTVDKGFPAKGTLNAYENFCLSQGQNYISGSSHREMGQTTILMVTKFDSLRLRIIISISSNPLCLKQTTTVF